MNVCYKGRWSVRDSQYNLAAVQHLTICITKFPCLHSVHMNDQRSAADQFQGQLCAYTMVINKVPDR